MGGVGELPVEGVVRSPPVVLALSSSSLGYRLGDGLGLGDVLALLCWLYRLSRLRCCWLLGPRLMRSPPPDPLGLLAVDVLAGVVLTMLLLAAGTSTCGC